MECIPKRKSAQESECILRAAQAAESMEKLTAAQAAECILKRGLMVTAKCMPKSELTFAHAAEKTLNSVAQEGSLTQKMTGVCSPIPLAPGFLLWRPCIAAKNIDDSNPSSPSSTSPVLVLLFTWLSYTPQNAAKYVSLYTNKGWDVLHISSQLLHFLWPPCSQSFALDIARVLKERCGSYTHIVVHAMSIGAYNYTACRMLANELPDLQIYLFTKLRAVVFDSLTIGSLDHMVHGIVTGVSQWGIIQKLSGWLASLYFLMTHKTTVQAFNEGVEFFRTNPAPVPTLVFGSMNDPMSDVKALHAVLHHWHSMAAFSLSFKIWDRSGHCSHLLHHTSEYQHLLNQFLRFLQCSPMPEDGGDEGAQAGRMVSSKL